MIPIQTEAPQKDLRPRHKRVRQGESDSALIIYVRKTLFEKLFWKVKNRFYKNSQSGSGISSPRAFQRWSWICRSPYVFFWERSFCVRALGVKSSCITLRQILLFLSSFDIHMLWPLQQATTVWFSLLCSCVTLFCKSSPFSSSSS